MKEGPATAIGFLVASVVPPAILSVAATFGGQLTPGSIAATFMVAFPFSAVFTVVFGIPTFLLLRRFAPGHWWSVLAVGFVLGTLVSIAIRLFGQIDLRGIVTMGPIGAASAFVFWLIWKQGRRPD